MSRSLVSLVFLIGATLLMLFWHAMGAHLLHTFSMTYTFLMNFMQPFLRDHSLRQIVVVLLAPLLLGLIPVFIYWIIRRRWLYEYMTIVWCIWLVMITMVMIKQGYR